MIKKTQTFLFVLLWVAPILSLYGQVTNAVIDLRELNSSSSKSKSATYQTLLKELTHEIQDNKSLSIIDKDGNILQFPLEEVILQGNATVRLLSGGNIKSDNKNKDDRRYFTSTGTYPDQGDFFLIINSDNILGSWKKVNRITEFDIGEGEINFHPTDDLKSKTIPHNQLCNLQNHKTKIVQHSFEKSLNEQKSIEIGVVLDNSYVTSAGGIQESINKVKAVLASSSIDFSQEFDTPINFVLNDIVLSDCATCDPWTNSTKSNEVQTDVRQWVQRNERLNSNDVVLFWSAREFDNNILGSAQANSICTPYNTVVLRDKSDILWKLRVIASHEIGHTLGGVHDSNYSSTIMNPTLVNSATWSSSSIASINEGITTASCLNYIETPCSEIEEIEIEVLDFAKIRIHFDRGEVDSVRLEVHTTSSNIADRTFSIGEGEQWIELDYIPCTNYKFEFISYCNEAPKSHDILWSSQIENTISIQSVNPSNCRISAGIPIYDLVIEVESLEEKPIRMRYKAIEYEIVVYEGVHSYVIPGIVTTDMEEVMLSMVESGSDSYNCYDVIYVDEPSHDCAFQYFETFENCSLPAGWSTYSDDKNVHQEYEWRIAGSDRDIQNYGSAGNAETSKTIDGSCMAILDDDLINLANYSGIAYIESPVFNLEQYDSVLLSFDLIFDEFMEKGSNSSSLVVEVYENNDWHEVVRYAENSCVWYDIWNPSCIDHVIIDISDLRSNKTAIRWKFNDGDVGEWGGMAAVDNIKVDGVKKISSPCTQNDIYVDESPLQSIETSGGMLYLSTMLDIPSANFNVSEGAIFSAGATINPGVNLNVAIDDCEN